MNSNTKDPVNQCLVELEKEIGLNTMGLMTSQVWHDDPRRLVFSLARYKFVSKMLSGKKQVTEIGCGDGFASRIVAQEVGQLSITDYDPLFIEKFQQQLNSVHWPITAFTHDILKSSLSEKADAIYSLDVMEHINLEDETNFITHICQSLNKNGVAILGMPSLESQHYASPASKAGHVNCKSGDEFKRVMEQYFANVFLFSMNDEVVHTGYSKMAHYLIAICTSPLSSE